MADIDRKIAANKRRLDHNPEETAKFTNLLREIGEVEAAAQAAIAEVERLGEEGEVEASLQELAKADALREEKEAKEKELQQLNESAGASGHQKLRVCDVCGAYLSILDSDRRLADHFGGKVRPSFHVSLFSDTSLLTSPLGILQMHLGYLKLRQMIEVFEQKRRDGTGPAAALAAGVGTPLPNQNGGRPPSGGPGMMMQNGGGMRQPFGGPGQQMPMGLPTGPRDGRSGG